MNQNIAGRMSRPGPRRILSLDGGGIRGVISLEVMASQAPEGAQGAAFVLADFFDCVVGTSVLAGHASEAAVAGIEQVHRALSEMDQTTQLNATLVVQAAGAAPRFYCRRLI